MRPRSTASSKSSCARSRDSETKSAGARSSVEAPPPEDDGVPVLPEDLRPPELPRELDFFAVDFFAVARPPLAPAAAFFEDVLREVDEEREEPDDFFAVARPPLAPAADRFADVDAVFAPALAPVFAAFAVDFAAFAVDFAAEVVFFAAEAAFFAVLRAAVAGFDAAAVLRAAVPVFFAALAVFLAAVPVAFAADFVLLLADALLRFAAVVRPPLAPAAAFLADVLRLVVERFALDPDDLRGCGIPLPVWTNSRGTYSVVPTRNSSSAFCACRRFSAWSQMRCRDP
jgi:hypothetical protein